jgi:hypothetical protein
MANTTQKRGFGARINRWLDEAPGETFKQGKWRFWLPMVIGFGLLNAVLTAMIFGSAGQLQTYIGAIMLSIGALLAWLCVGTLHYSDSRDVRMARGVAALDSLTLVFVIAHFSFLLWIQGHVWALQSREADYKASATAYNEKAEKVSIDNAKIATSAERIAIEESKRARIENDTIYQARKAAQAGARISTQRPGAQSIAPSLSTSPIELERPDKPKESSTDFLTRWDFWIRLANFGELALAAITFIFIRNRSAKFNAGMSRRDVDEFPDELDEFDLTVRGSSKEPRLTRTHKSDSGRLSPISRDSAARKEALKILREHLKEIAFYHPGLWFKADLVRGGVTIRLFKKDHGHEIMVARTDQSDKLLAAVERPDFRARLLDELIYQGFPLDKATG